MRIRALAANAHAQAVALMNTVNMLNQELAPKPAPDVKKRSIFGGDNGQEAG